MNWNKAAYIEKRNLEESQNITGLCMHQLEDTRYIWILGRRKSK